MTLAEVLNKSPALLTIPDSQGRVIDPIEIFKEFCRTLGIRNIDSYMKQAPMPQPMPGQMPGQPGLPPGQPMPQTPVRVMPDQQVQQQVQAGNVIPFRQAGQLP